MIAGGAFAVIAVAALAVIGVLVLPGHGGNPTHSKTSAPASHVPSQPASATVASPQAASPKGSYAVDSCIVGTWKDAGDTLTNTIDGESLQFTGRGGGVTVSADGAATEELGPETLTATDSAGNTWSEVLSGSVTYQVTTSGGEIRFSDISTSPDAMYKLYEDGVFHSSGPESVSTTPFPYTCSSSSMHWSYRDGTSTYDRAS